jgi:parallel beta-helix repeat protein
MVAIHNCLFDGNDLLNAIMVNNCVASVTVAGNEIRNAQLVGINIIAVRNNAVVSDNYIETIETGMTALPIQVSERGYCSPITGIFSGDASMCSTLVSDNEIDTARFGITISDATEAVVMRNDIYVDEMSSYPDKDGIGLLNSSNCQISQNQISGKAYVGIFLQGSANFPSNGNMLLANNLLQLDADAPYCFNQYSYGNTVAGYSGTSTVIDETDPNPTDGIYEGENVVSGCKQVADYKGIAAKMTESKLSTHCQLAGGRWDAKRRRCIFK